MSSYDGGSVVAKYGLDTTEFERSVRRVTALYQQMEQAQQRATSTAAAPVRAPATPRAPQVGADFDKVNRQFIALQQSEIRAAVALGDYDRALSLTKSEMLAAGEGTQRYNQLLVQQVGIQRQADRASEQRVASLRKEQDALRNTLTPPKTETPKGGELQGLAGLAVTGFVGKQALDLGIEAGKSALALRETQAGLRAVAGSQEAYNQTVQVAREQQRLFGGSLQDNIEGLTGLTITSKQSGAELKTLVDLSQRLGVLDPAQGAAGARIALSEALSGDPTSLAKRYEIPKAALAKLRDESIPTAERLKIIDDYLNRVGITSESVAGRIDKTRQAYNDLGAAADTAKTTIGGFLADALAPAATAGAGLLGGSGFDGFVAGVETLKASLSGLPPANAAVQASNEQLANSFLRLIGLAQEPIAPPIPPNPGIDAFAESSERAGLASDRMAQAALAAGGAMDVERQAAAELQIVTGLAATDIQRSADASLLDAAQKDLQQQQVALLNAQTEQTVQAFLALNPGISASAAASLAAAQGYGPQIGQLGAIAIAAENARLALARMNLEAALSKGTGAGAFSNGVIPRSIGGGPTIGAKGLGAGAGRDQSVLDNANRLRDSENQLALARARNGSERIAILNRELGQTNDQIRKNQILAQIEGERGSGGGGKGKGPKAPKLTDQQKLNNSLLADQEKYQDKSEDAATQHAIEIEKINKEFYRKELEQLRENEISKRASQADFYDRLTSSDLNKNKKHADALKKVDADYQAAFQKSQELAQSGQAKLAADYLSLKQKQTDQELTYQEKLAKAKDDKDKGEVSRLERVHELRLLANTEEEKQLLAGGDANVNAREKALADANQKELDAQDKIGLAADRAADRKIDAALRSGKAIEAENLALEKQNGLYATLPNGQAPGGGQPTPVPGANPAAPPAATAPMSLVSDAALLGAVQAQTDMQRGKFDAMIARLGDVERAVRGIRLTGGVAG